MSEDKTIDYTQVDEESNKPDHTLLDIDYSMVEDANVAPAASDWEPPKHVYFGKKLANGRMETEPVYVYQEYPRMLYGLIEGRVRARVVKNDADKKALLDAGYKLGPGDFGLETCPAREVVNARAIVAEKLKPIVETETVQIVKRGPGRPRKNK